MRPQYRYAPFAFLFMLNACAHSPRTPTADPPTYERIARVMQSVEKPDSVIPGSAIKAAAPRTTSKASGVNYTDFELPVQYNERVQDFVELYSVRRRTVFTTWLGRMERYREYIEQRLDALGMPRELIYVPLIESAYEANVASQMSAVGLWQFMKGTARSEGLEVSEYVDERRDPFRSTDAALQHLNKLYNQFDSWYLAFAAYNSGSGRIIRLLKQNGFAKEDSAYWALRDALPRETRDYVPMLLGAAIVGENAASFGLSPKPEAPVRFDEVTVPGATDLKTIARAADVSLAQIKELNPQFIKAITPPGRRSRVRVPIGAAAAFEQAFPSLGTQE
ncbi:MAG TPA: lytic transglycosylase domain-containing protein [Longimicrobiales bacterium]